MSASAKPSPPAKGWFLVYQAAVIKEFLTTAADGKNYTTKYYNRDAIISVGYRANSAIATRFRICAITGHKAAK